MQLETNMADMNKSLLIVINVDWYFNLHWLERALFFKRSGFDVHIVTNYLSVEIQNKLIEYGFHCHHISISRKSLNPFVEISTGLKLYRLIAKLNPSLIHCVTIKPNIYVGLINKLIFNKPIVFSITGLGAVFSSNKFHFKLIRKLVSFLYAVVSTANSKFIFENGEDYSLFLNNDILKFDNGVVIKGAGIDLLRFKPSIPLYNKSVLFAARLLWDKGLSDLIDAKKILSNKGVNFTLNVAGIVDSDVSSAIPLKKIHNWAENGDINWLGNVNDMPSLIQNNDIICLPTVYGEGVPRILIEAAACQRAIITTDVVGCREIVTDGYNGFLTIPGDPHSLALALEKLLANYEQIKKFGANGRRKAENEFSQENVFKETLKIYKELS